MAQALSFLRILEADLKAISSETRKRLPAARDAADRAQRRLLEVDASAEEGNEDAAGGAGADALSRALSKAEEVPLAFCAACDASLPKATLLGVGGIHKLVMHSAVAPSALEDIVDALERLVENSDDQAVLLKVLEALLTLLTSPYYRGWLEEGSGLQRGLTLLAKLSIASSTTKGTAKGSAAEAAAAAAAEPPAGVLQQTAEISFRQVCSEVFLGATQDEDDAGVDGDEPDAPGDSLPPRIRTADLLFRDLCALVNGDACHWLSVQSLRRTLVLEVVEAALRGELFRNSARMRALLTSRLCPALHELLCSSADPRVYQMLVRVVFLLVVNFLGELHEDIEVLLVLLVRTVDRPESLGEAAPPLHRIYALEALRAAFCHDGGEVILRLNEAFDTNSHASRVVGSTVDLASRLAQGAPDRLSAASVELLAGRHAPFRSPLLKAPKGDEAVPVLALSICLSTLRATASHARDQPASAELLRGSWEMLFVALLPVFSATAADPAPNVRAVELVAGAVREAVALGDLPELGGARSAAVDALCSASGAAIRRGDAVLVPPLFRALVAVTTSCNPPLAAEWGPVVRLSDELDVAGRSVDNAALRELAGDVDGFYRSACDLEPEGKAPLVDALVARSRAHLEPATGEGGSDEAPNENVQSMWRAHALLLDWITESNGDGLSAALWGRATGHLSAVATSHPKAAVREQALRVIQQLLSAALGTLDDATISHSEVLEPLCRLSASTSIETRTKALDALRAILVAKGEQIQGEGAWERVMLALQASVAADGAADAAGAPAVEEGDERSAVLKAKEERAARARLLQLGFKAVQLVAADFLTAMPFSTVGSFVDVLGLYGVQNMDVNTALTSVSLLWEVADFLAKSDEPHRDALWRTIFGRLKQLGLDARPEVRNGAIKSLIGTLMAHGPLFSDNAWQVCLEECLVPLQREAMVGGIGENEEASVAPADATGPGSGGGPDRRVILHHTRDTPEKQWNETRHLVLTGMARVYRRYTASIRGLPAFPGAWTSTLDAASAAAVAAGAPKEIAIAAVGTMLEMSSVAAAGRLGPGGEDDALGAQLWTTAWRAIDDSVWASTAADEQRAFVANRAALVQLCGGLVALRNGGEGSAPLPARDTLDVISVLARIACTEDPATSGSTEVARAALTSMAALELGAGDGEGWAFLVRQMLKLLLATRRDAALDDFIRRGALEALRDLYQGGRMPSYVRANQLGEVVSTLVPIMKARDGASEDPVAARSPAEPAAGPLWASAVDTFQVVVTNGSSGGGVGAGGLEYRDSAWPVLVDAFEEFLVPSRTSARRSSRTYRGAGAGARVVLTTSDLEDLRGSHRARLAETVQMYDVRVVHTMVAVLKRSRGSAEKYHARMLQVLAAGATQGWTRFQFGRACQSALFSLARDPPAAEVQHTAYSALTSACKMVLGSYVQDGRRSGKCPLPATRRAEVLFLLTELQSLGPADDGTAPSAVQRHVVELYPTICQCIESADADVRTLTRELLARAGAVFGAGTTGQPAVAKEVAAT